MYDSWPGCFVNGKMQLYDVGMAAMHTMDTQALSTLDDAIGRHRDAAMRKQRASTMGLMEAMIEGNLWDNHSDIYVNPKPSGDFYRHIFTTLFYPLQVCYWLLLLISTVATRCSG